MPDADARKPVTLTREELYAQVRTTPISRVAAQYGVSGYLDVTENLQGIPLAREVALAVRAKIKDVTGLNASAGISYNKFLAKLAECRQRDLPRHDHRESSIVAGIATNSGPRGGALLRQPPLTV